MNSRSPASLIRIIWCIGSLHGNFCISDIITVFLLHRISAVSDMSDFSISLEKCCSSIDLNPHERLIIEILDKSRVYITRSPEKTDSFITLL